MEQSGERFDTAFQLSKDIVMGKFKPRIQSENGEFDVIAERRRQEEIEAQLIAAMHRKKMRTMQTKSRVYEMKVVPVKTEAQLVNEIKRQQRFILKQQQTFNNKNRLKVVFDPEAHDWSDEGSVGKQRDKISRVCNVEPAPITLDGPQISRNSRLICSSTRSQNRWQRICEPPTKIQSFSSLTRVDPVPQPQPIIMDDCFSLKRTLDAEQIYSKQRTLEVRTKPTTPMIKLGRPLTSAWHSRTKTTFLQTYATATTRTGLHD